jgi:hypothetical protein
VRLTLFGQVLVGRSDHMHTNKHSITSFPTR